MKTVLLIGDSIRMNYCVRVRELLRDEARVVFPEENCRFAKYTLWSINEWIENLADGKPDIIHWNNGIWDAYRRSDRIEVFTPLNEYLYDLERIAVEMKHYCNNIIFATTTPVRKGFNDTSNETIDRYNAEAVGLMKNLGISVNDLNSVIRPETEMCLCDDLLHLNDYGTEKSAQHIAGLLSKTL